MICVCSSVAAWPSPSGPDVAGAVGCWIEVEADGSGAEAESGVAPRNVTMTRTPPGELAFAMTRSTSAVLLRNAGLPCAKAGVADAPRIARVKIRQKQEWRARRGHMSTSPMLKIIIPRSRLSDYMLR